MLCLLGWDSVDYLYRYLSVVAGVISEAAYVFCPEMPPPPEWPTLLAEKLQGVREDGPMSGMCPPPGFINSSIIIIIICPLYRFSSEHIVVPLQR